MFKVAVVLLFIVGGGMALRTWLQKHGSPRPTRVSVGPVQERTITVGAATISPGNIQVTVNALGTVTPLATVTVQTQINGRVTEVGFSEGQTVKKGDFLVQIDPRTYEILKDQYEGQLARDQALLAQAKINFARYKALVETDSGSRQQYVDQGFLVHQYEAAVKIDQAQIDQQTLNIEYCRIVSPIIGRIGLRWVDPGNYLQATNNKAIAVINQVQPTSVLFTIPEQKLPQILAEMNTGRTLRVTAYDRANIRKLGVGRISALDSQIDTSTGTVMLRALFENEEKQLFPNQFVNIRLLVETHEGVLKVPVGAIRNSDPGNYVYLIQPDNTVTVRKIKVGTIDGDMAQVESGLKDGERVVIDGADQLREGTKVTVSAEADGTGPVDSAAVAP
jgi:multidrug efflux system membrane fusion protein